jgi:adenosylmethionine-8-amino-7-oxononanoate aminotransferase
MSALSEKDKQHVWHPFTQAKTALPPLVINRGRGRLVIF